jgi:hypothetical protein
MIGTQKSYLLKIFNRIANNKYEAYKTSIEIYPTKITRAEKRKL